MNRNTISILGLGALLAGCTLMPKYDRPTAPVPSSWPVAATNSALTNAQSASASAADIDWHHFFSDPRLRNLISVALENNRDLRIAALRVEQARAQYRIERAGLFPGVAGEASFVRQKFSGAATTFSGGAILSTYTVDVAPSYELDLFGRVRSLKTEALERYFASDEARRTAQIALVSQIATEYLTQLRLREAKAVANQTLKTVQTSYDLIKRSFEAG